MVAVERSVLVTVLLATFGLLVLQVLTRYVFAAPLSWTEELARFLLVWLTFLAAGHLAGRRLHIRVDLVVDRLGSRGALVVDVLAGVVVIATSAVMTVAAVALVASAAGLTAPASGVPIPVVYLAAALGFALMCAHTLVHLVRRPGQRGGPALPGTEPVGEEARP
ncbi:TRAP transporter small permease [Nocardiopsis sp. MG754419]|nr:TRAP transporter small permease [Nocardiopsis sp. MG754419]